MTPEQSLDRFAEIVAVTRGTDVALNVALSTAFGCPFDGAVAADRVLGIVQRVADLGIGGVSLCDTTGMANPRQAGGLLGAVRERFPQMQLTAHFHNTRGMGLANALAALEVGIDRFDASLGGLGGCPFAPGATGNICTEDLVHMFAQMGLDTGVDLKALLAIAAELPAIVGHDVPGQVMKAGPSDRRYPVPEGVA
jgi:hydroxymethylglutaryl-CoA lyase